MPFKQFAVDEILTSSDVNNYLMMQSVSTFFDAYYRDLAILGPVVGQMVFLQQDKIFQYYDGARWKTISQIESPNFVINGGFDIWQRGTTTSTIGVFLADRWVSNVDAGTLTTSRSTDVPAASPFTYSLSLAATSATNARIRYVFEALDAEQFAGVPVTFSLWAKSTVGTAGLTLTTYYPSASDNWTSATTDQTITLAASMTVGSWTRYTATFTPNALCARGMRFFVARNATTTSTTTLFTGAQLELGSTATVFRRSAPTSQAELAACQRYYFRKNAGSTSGVFGSGFASTATLAYAFIPFPVEMRTAPTTTLDWTGTVGNYRILYTNTSADLSATPTIASASNTPTGVTVSATVAAGLTAGQGILLISNLAGGSYLGFSAEL